jgi:hypothetical protein
MNDKKPVRRYVVRTRLFSLRDPRRDAELKRLGLGYYGEKLPPQERRANKKPAA